MTPTTTKPTTRPFGSSWIPSEKGRYAAFALLAAGLGGALWGLPYPPLATVALLLFAVTAYVWFRRLGRGVPVVETALFVGAIQWLGGPFFSFFVYPSAAPNRQILVDATTYFGLAVPGTLLFGVGLLAGAYAWRRTGAGLPQRWRATAAPSVGGVLALYAVGYAAQGVATLAVPSGGRFLVHLLTFLPFVGFYRLLLSGHRYAWVAGLLAFVPVLLRAVRESLFHEVLLWGIFTGMLLLYRYRVRRWYKLAWVLLAAFGVLTLETLKQEYRTYTWWEADQYQLTEAEKALLFPRLALKYAAQPDYLFSAKNLTIRLPRFSQAWLVSRYQQHVPAREPFARGETYLAGVEASLLPRALAPHKMRSGGRGTYERFSGKKLPAETSLSLTTLGEAYVNFGPKGAVGALLALGLLMGLIFRVGVAAAGRTPEVLAWLPFVLLYFPVAELDFTTVFNYTLKAAAVAAVWVTASAGVRRFFPAAP